MASLHWPPVGESEGSRLLMICLTHVKHPALLGGLFCYPQFPALPGCRALIASCPPALLESLWQELVPHASVTVCRLEK